MKGFIHRLFTGSPRVIHTLADLMADVAVLESTVKRLETRLASQDAAHQALVERVHKLTGQVHGPRGGRPRLVGVDSVPPGDKDALREYAGLRPGAKFKHEPE